MAFEPKKKNQMGSESESESESESGSESSSSESASDAPVKKGGKPNPLKMWAKKNLG